MIFKLSLPDRLRELPDFDPPAGGWMRLTERLERPAARYRPLLPLALAASISLALGLAALLPTSAPDVPAPTPSKSATQVAALMQQSQVLEARLQSVRPQVMVWNGALADTAAHLKSDLAVVDLQLAYAGPKANPQAVQRLWQDRVALMSRLVQTHEEATLAPTRVAALEQSL
jgi:hypothetical protein